MGLWNLNKKTIPCIGVLGLYSKIYYIENDQFSNQYVSNCSFNLENLTKKAS